MSSFVSCETNRLFVTDLVSSRVGSVILVVKITSEAEPTTLRGGPPQIGTASVENDHEVLRRTAEPNLPIVLQIDHETLKARTAASRR